MNVWNPICGIMKNANTAAVIPDNFFALRVKDLNQRLHVQIEKLPLTDFTVKIWDYLDQVEVLECNTLKQLQHISVGMMSTTRRGAGKVLICSPSFVDSIEQSIVDTPQDAPWTEKFSIHEHPGMPDGEAVLAYRGISDIDAGLFMYESPDGRLTIYKEAPEFKKYVRRLKIKGVL